MGPSSNSGKPKDPDEQEAWDELNAFLAGDESKPDAKKTETFSKRDKLRKDYIALGVPFGSSLEEVKKAYKRLLRQHHPDRNAQNPERLKAATEFTKNINISYRRIRDFESKKVT